MMNWIDLVILLVLGLYVFHGWRRGLLLIVLDSVGFVVSVAAGLVFYKYAAPIFHGLGLGPALSGAMGFLGILVLTQLCFWQLSRTIYRSIPKSARGCVVNRALGIIPSVAKGFVLCSLMVMALVVLPTRVPQRYVLDSTIGSRMLVVASAVERAAASLFGEAIREGLTFLTVGTGTTELIRIPAQTKDVVADFKAERKMLALLNKERAAKGLKALAMDSKLRTLARKHSRDMFARGYFAHVDPDGKSPFDRMREAEIEYAEAGENLAKAPSVSIAHRGLMNSPGHRANILDPKFGKVGIGVYSSEIHGKMFSQEFTD